MSAPAVSVQGVSFSYDGPPILDNVNLEIERGEFLGLVGPNGGGKSTLLKILLGLLKPDKGRVALFGQPVQQGRAAVGYVPQHVQLDRHFPVNVLQTVLLGRLGKHSRWLGFDAREKDLAWAAMRETGVTDLHDRALHTLSGGQFQRVLIARALVGEPDMLLLDEPTSNIDLRREEDIFDVLKRLNQTITIVVVSHDIGFISQYVNRVACLNRTLVCHETAAISGKTIEQLYGAPVHMIQHSH